MATFTGKRITIEDQGGLHIRISDLIHYEIMPGTTGFNLDQVGEITNLSIYHRQTDVINIRIRTGESANIAVYGNMVLSSSIPVTSAFAALCAADLVRFMAWADCLA